MEYGKFGNCLAGRLYAIRKDKKLNQEEFGKRIGVTRSAICNYEGGTRPIGEQVILAVCREFSVNDLWMREGVGAPYRHPQNGIIDALISEYYCSKFEGDFLKVYFQMDEEERTKFISCAYRLFEPLMKGMRGRNPFAHYFDATSVEDDEMDQINRDSDEYRKKLVRERYGIRPIAKGEVDESESTVELPSSVAEAESLYESSSGFVRNTGLSALNTTGGTASLNGNTQKRTTTESGGGESGNEVG